MMTPRAPLTHDSPESRAVAYYSTIQEKALVLIRAQTSTVKNGKKAMKKLYRAPKRENPEFMVQQARNGVCITEIARVAQRSREFVWCRLALAGVDMRPLREPFANSPEPTEAIGLKMREMIQAGRKPYEAARSMEGVTLRIALESLGMVGGVNKTK
jgi:hypothetical protein